MWSSVAEASCEQGSLNNVANSAEILASIYFEQSDNFTYFWLFISFRAFSFIPEVVSKCD